MTRAKLGRLIHPDAVTQAWYEQDCPPRLDISGLSRRDLMRWRLACWLRGRETYRNWKGAHPRPLWLRLDWWLPVGNSNVFDGPGAWLYFFVRGITRRGFDA